MKVKPTLLILVLAIATIVFSIKGCTDIDGATKTLKINNYKPLTVGGYDFFGGSENDVYKTRFKAVAPNKIDTVTGTVTKDLQFV